MLRCTPYGEVWFQIESNRFFGYREWVACNVYQDRCMVDDELVVIESFRRQGCKRRINGPSSFTNQQQALMTNRFYVSSEMRISSSH